MTESLYKKLDKLIEESGIDLNLLMGPGFLEEYLASAVSLAADDASAMAAFQGESGSKTELMQTALRSVRASEGKRKTPLAEQISKIKELQSVVAEYKAKHPED